MNGTFAAIAAHNWMFANRATARITGMFETYKNLTGNLDLKPPLPTVKGMFACIPSANTTTKKTIIAKTNGSILFTNEIKNPWLGMLLKNCHSSPAAALVPCPKIAISPLRFKGFKNLQKTLPATPPAMNSPIPEPIPYLLTTSSK